MENEPEGLVDLQQPSGFLSRTELSMFTFQLDLARPLDRMRYRLGDKDPETKVFEDETILAILGLQPSEDAALLSLAKAAEQDLARRASKVNVAEGDEYDFRDRISALRRLISELESSQQVVNRKRAFRTLRPRRTDIY